MSEHTPTPWAIYPNPMRDDGVFIGTAEQEIEEIPRLGYTEKRPVPTAMVLSFQVKHQDADLIVQSVNAFAALAEHLGCKPEDLNVDLVQWYEIILGASRMPADSAIGSLVKVTATRELAQFDTVDRADIAQTGEHEVALRTVKSSKKAGTVSRSAVKKAVRADIGHKE